MNPLFPRDLFIPDGEAHVMPDGRLYVYGSMDVSGNMGYCSGQYHVLSTDDPDLEHWVDHGVAFDNSPQCLGPVYAADTLLYAPDALYINGKCYLYYCTSTGAEGVAVSDSPAGPFGDSRHVAGASGTGIDPAVFQDDDGSVYYFWGQFSLCGAKMQPDFASIDVSTLRTDILTEHQHGFHEGASLRKYNGKYYLVYTSTKRGSARCLAWAVADAPLGPYREGGVLVDNTGCDPQSWNDHGSIECFHGQWYVFYHRSSQNSQFCRRLCAEKIFFDANGELSEVPMTCSPAGPLDAFAFVDGGRASRVGGGYIMPEQDGMEKLTGFPDSTSTVWPSWAEFRSLDFGVGAKQLRVTACGKGSLWFVTEDDHRIACVDIDAAEFTRYTVPVAQISGEHTLWIRFYGANMQLKGFEFV